MIAINYASGFTVYLCAWMLFLAILWTRELWRRNVYDWSVSEGSLCICEHCRYAFLVKSGETFSRCPKCNGMCRVRRKRN